MQGIEEVYADMLRERKEIFAYEDLHHLKQRLSKKIFNWFPKARAERGIRIASISRDSVMARSFSKNNETLLRENRYLQAADFKTDINIYANKIVLMDLRGNPPFCVLIENKHLADTMRIIWKSLWSQLEPEE